MRAISVNICEIWRWIYYNEVMGNRNRHHKNYEAEYDLQAVKEELADVLIYSQDLLDNLGLDADEIVNMKMEQNEKKYPVEKAKGNETKYDRL